MTTVITAGLKVRPDADNDVRGPWTYWSVYDGPVRVAVVQVLDGQLHRCEGDPLDPALIARVLAEIAAYRTRVPERKPLKGGLD